MQARAIRRAALPRAPPAVRRLLVERRVALRGRDGVPAPHLLAGHGVVRRHVAADAVLTTRHADDDVVVDDQRRVRDAVAVRRVGDLDVPYNFARRRVQCDQTGVEGSHVHVRAVDGDTAIVRAAAVDRGAELVLVAPELLAGVEVVRDRRVERRRDVGPVADDDRRVLERAELRDAGLQHAARHQPGDVAGIDFIQAGVTLVPLASAVRGPVVSGRLLRGRGARDQAQRRQPAESTKIHLWCAPRDVVMFALRPDRTHARPRSPTDPVTCFISGDCGIQVYQISG